MTKKEKIRKFVFFFNQITSKEEKGGTDMDPQIRLEYKQ